MLTPRASEPSNVQETPQGWRLQIPSDQTTKYHLAQLDNYKRLPRRFFLNQSPSSLDLICRASKNDIPGTWGFGFWNDPFTLSIGLRGTEQRLPVLPNASWFFHASPENHLSFHKNFPGSGFMAQTFRSPKIPSSLLLPAGLAAPFLFIKRISKLFRSFAGKIIAEDSKLLQINTTQWHAYNISWDSTEVRFCIDGDIVFKTSVSPQGPLGIVIWIDNQFAAWKPNGIVSMGAISRHTPAWLEIKQITINSSK